MLLLLREGVADTRPRRITAAVLLTGAFALRFAVLDYETLDYQNFLTVWVDFFRRSGGIRAIGTPVGNYNIPYLFFLALCSYLDFPDLYLIKMFSVAFDVVLSWGCMKLVRHFDRRQNVALAAFLGALWLPTVFLNGALWGQCDVIYVSLAVVSLWAAFSGRSRLSLAMIALSFAFKLQAIFFCPVFLVLLVHKRIPWRQLWIVPATYVAAVSPAIIAGRDFLETVLLYFTQTDSIGTGLNYNSSSVYAFYRGGGNEAALARLGLGAAFIFCGLLLWGLCRRKSVDDRTLLAAFTLCVICVPLLLPHMHDRYFFGADVMSLVLSLTALPLLPIVPLCSFASLLGYHAYLKMKFFLPMKYGAEALIAAALAVTVYMRLSLRKMPPETEEFFPEKGN